VEVEVQAVHQVLGFATAAGVIVGLAWSILLARGADMHRRWFDRLGLLVAAIVVAEVVTGAFRQSSGGTPQPLHALLAGIAVLAIPVTRSLSGYLGGLGSREPWVWFAIYAILGAALLGLFQTGGVATSL
jgi:hypothetical protein